MEGVCPVPWEEKEKSAPLAHELQFANCLRTLLQFMCCEQGFSVSPDPVRSSDASMGPRQ